MNNIRTFIQDHLTAPLSIVLVIPALFLGLWSWALPFGCWFGFKIRW